MTGEEHLPITQNIVISIRNSFMTRSLTAVCVPLVRTFLIWEQAQAYCREIYIAMVQNGQQPISRKTRLNRPNFFPKAWTLIITLFPRKTSAFRTNALMSLPPANASGILTIRK